MNTKPNANDWYDNVGTWRDEVGVLRDLLSDLNLTETIKWGSPCYIHSGRNLVSVQAFKSYFGLWFFDGALLADPEGILINAQSGKTQAQRQWRMQSAGDIRKATIRRYVREAMTLARDGRTVEPAKPAPVAMPGELRDVLASNKRLMRRFDELRPAEQREFVRHVGEAKRADTRRRRVEKIIPLILDGEGLNDRYRR